jgi:hypothetical protein
MKALTRRQQIGIAINELINPDHLTKNPLLASLAIKHPKGIPLTAILLTRSFASINATIGEVMSVFDSMTDFKYLVEEQFFGITFPFMVVENRIIIKNLPEDASEDDLLQFTQMLTNETVEIVDFSSNNCVLQFNDSDSLFAFWRALTFVPFNHTFLKAQISYREKKPQEKGNRKKRMEMNAEKKKMAATSPTRDIKIQKKANNSLVLKFELGKRAFDI